MPELQVYLLGRFQIFVDGLPLEESRWARKKSKVLHKVLALSPGHSMHPEQLLEILWPEMEDEAAFSEFHRITSPLVKAFLTRILKDHWNTEEVMQDVYLYVWQNAKAWSPVRGTPVTWLYTLARSRALDTWRRNKRTSGHVEFDEYVANNAAFVVWGEATDVWSRDRIRENVALLPLSRKQILELAFAEGYTHSEIAEVTGLLLGTVKTWIRSTLGQLRSVILPVAA